MLSISRIESLSHGLDYYTKDNYYAKEDQKEYTQWFGKAASSLCLKNHVLLKDFKNALAGVSKTGILGIQEKKVQPDNYISYEQIFKFRDKSYKYVDSLDLNGETKEKIKQTLHKISDKNEKLNKSSLSKYQRNFCSLVNKDSSLSIDEKKKIKDFLQKETEFFSKISSRRPGYDLTFSAPKSVSIAGLVGGDSRIIFAHRGAVEATLKVVEDEYSQTRVRESGKSERNIEVTGNIAVATFEHDVSRKTDPQLHTHCVVMNFTRKKDGTWRSINQDGFFYDSKKLGLIYQNELARRVKKLGYDIHVNANGTFDIKGYSKEQLDQFSKRTNQMNELGAKTQKEKTRLVKIKRDKKDESISRIHLKQKWEVEAKSIGIVHPEPKIIADKKIPCTGKSQENNIDLIIQNSMNEVTVHDVSFKSAKLETAILSKLIGQESFAYEKVKEDISTFLAQNTKEVKSKNVLEYVPFYILDQEKESILLMQKGKDTVDSIVNIAQARKITDELHTNSIASGYMGLNPGQREAIEMMLTMRDKICAWQGVAGSGKSFSLASVVRVATERGYTVKGFAPSAESSKILAIEAKIPEANTLAYLLAKESTVGKFGRNEIWIIDEAGLLSASDAHSLLKMAARADARVILVGDTRQLSSVGAGNPFKQLQSYGMRTAQLTQGVRQVDPTIKQSVDLIARGEHKSGLEILDNAGKVFEVKSEEETIANMAKDYLSLNNEDLSKSLFVASTNYEKKEITNIIRAELKSAAKLSNSKNITSYIQYDYNAYVLKHSYVYSVGDIVVPNKQAYGLQANQPYEVMEISHKNNSIIVASQNDKSCQKEINVAKLSCNLFREEKLELCIGDRVKWTKNHFPAFTSNQGTIERQTKRLNGQYLTLESFDIPNRIGVFKYENGRTENVDLSKSQFLDYSYVTTIFSSQGRTCDKVYASLTHVDRENFYVTISRAKYDCKIYSTDKEKLFANIEKSRANITAHEKIAKDLNINVINDLVSKKEVRNIRHNRIRYR